MNAMHDKNRVIDWFVTVKAGDVDAAEFVDMAVDVDTDTWLLTWQSRIY